VTRLSLVTIKTSNIVIFAPIMPILLITVSFVATVAAFWQMGRTTNDCFRSAFLKASILHGIIIAVLTEELSLSKSLTFEFIILGWSLFALLN